MPKHLPKFVARVFGCKHSRQCILERNHSGECIRDMFRSKIYRNFAAPDTPKPQTPKPKPQKPQTVEELKQEVENAKAARLQRDVERQKVKEAAQVVYMDVFEAYLLKRIAHAHNRDMSSFKVGWLDFEEFDYDTQQTGGEHMGYSDLANAVCAELLMGNLIKGYRDTPGLNNSIDIEL